MRLDRAFQRSVPIEVVDKLDQAIIEFQDEPQIDEPAEPVDREAERAGAWPSTHRNLHELASEPVARPRGLVRLVAARPVRLTLGELGDALEEGDRRDPNPRLEGWCTVRCPIGPYRLAVIPIDPRSIGRAPWPSRGCRTSRSSCSRLRSEVRC